MPRAGRKISASSGAPARRGLARRPRGARARSAGGGGGAPLTYYSAWFCPFAHRATIALEHHGIDYEWVEALGWERREASGDEDFDASESDDWWYHWKHPDLLRANPDGMVPTITSADGRLVVTESIVCCQFADGVAAAARRRAGGPWEAARALVWASRVNTTVTSEYYKCLVRTDETERREAFDRLVEGLARRGQAAPSSPARPGIVDCVLLPYAFRLYVLEHCRGFAVPRDRPWSDAYSAWLDAATGLPNVAKTLPDKAKYLKHVAKYAHGAARSKVGNAVRRGANAHDYDHKIDGDAAA
ncbi:glutathione transferase [Aureococcus anophagefferens]|nr:glutathione transferase [Aureococcus anophagefferens]